MERNKVLIMVEGAVMVALAFGLSLLTEFIPFLNLPWGGSITLLSMLPIIVYSIRNGVESGLACSFVYSLTQLAMGIMHSGLLGWGLLPECLPLVSFWIISVRLPCWDLRECSAKEKCRAGSEARLRR